MQQADRPDEGAVSTEYLFLMIFVALLIVLGVTAYGVTLGQGMADGAEDVRDAID